MALVEEDGTFLGCREFVIILQQIINQLAKWITKRMDS